MPTPADKRAAFRKLHESGCFIIPNPFDVGSAQRVAASRLQGAGVHQRRLCLDHRAKPTTASPSTTSATHLTAICAAVDIPVNADFEDGFAHEPDKVGVNVARAVKTGVAGLSIEDFTGDNAKPLFDRALAVDRIKAARKAIDADNSGVLLTGRCEAFLRGQKDLKLVIDRLTAYAEAGADCLYAPGIATTEEISAVVKAVRPRPVNLLVGAAGPSLKDRRRSRRSPHQRRRRAGADGMDRLHEGLKGDGGAGDVHRIRQRLSRRRTQQDVQLKHEPIDSEWPADVRFGAYAGLNVGHRLITVGTCERSGLALRLGKHHPAL